jgi:hypothetical protein
VRFGNNGNKEVQPTIRAFPPRWTSGYPRSHRECESQACIHLFRVNYNFCRAICKAISNMNPGLLARIIDRIVTNARVIRGAPEAVALVGIITLSVSYFALQHFHGESVTALNDKILSQERLLIDYRAKLKGAEAAAAQIEKLTSSLAAAQESLRQAKSTPVSIEKQSRDPRRLYEGNSPIALTQDPKVDLEKKKITFPIVNAAVILGTNKVYEFHDWKLACGGTQLYNMVNDGAAREFSYSPLTCRIVGNR